MKFRNFIYYWGSFLPSWIRIPNTDPDPLTLMNQDLTLIRTRNPELFTSFFIPGDAGVLAPEPHRPTHGAASQEIPE
jgi:hypothetical protein